MYDADAYSPGEPDPCQAPLATRPGQPGTLDARAIPAGTYGVDPDHTHVAWAVNHMGFSLLEGMFGASAGAISLDPVRPEKSRVEVSFNVGDLSVTTPAFAQHLKSPDLFDAARFPRARFVSTKVTHLGGGHATIAGDLTIRDVTRSVELQACFVGAGVNPMSEKLNFGFAAMAVIQRSDFGLGFIVPVVSDAVKLRINAAFAAG